MRLLLRAGADPEAKTRGLATPLHVAASAGQVEAMKLLMVCRQHPFCHESTDTMTWQVVPTTQISSLAVE